MIKEAINRIRESIEFLVEEYGIIDEHKTGILLDIEALDSLLTKKSRSKKRFPKIFKINERNGKQSMEERVEGTLDPPIFCAKNIYDTIVQAAINMQSEGKDFNRFTLIEAAQFLNDRVTMPAVNVCLHYWISMENALLFKKDGSDLFALTCGPENFQDNAKRAWQALREEEFRIDVPRGFM